jgi:nucleoside-diphosphate-sugar epimerase
VLFLTGATGYVGAHLLRRLVATGRPVRALVLPSDPTASLPPAPVDVVRGDVTDLASYAAHGAGVDAIVHSAALMLPNPPERIRRVNVEGTRALLGFAARWGVRRFVYLSAVSAVYAETNSYGRSKAEAEALVAAAGLDHTILRPTMIYGPGGGLHFQKLVGLVRRAPIVFPIVGGGRAQLQPVYIDDVVDAIEAVLRDPRAVGKTYNVSGASVVRFSELVDGILAQTRLFRLKVPVPAALCAAIARVVSAAVPGSFLSPEAILGLAQDATLDYSEFQRDCGYSPLPLAEGLKRALAPGRAPRA